MRALVKASVTPIKLEGRYEAEAADEALSGYIVEVIGYENNGWYKIRTHYNYEGFIYRDNLVIDEKKITKWEQGEKYYINHAAVDMMDIPHIRGLVTDTITRGCYVKLIHWDTSDALYAKVETPAGIGYIRKHFLTKTRPPYNFRNEQAFRSAVVAEAVAYLGSQYRWGGKTPLGIDCSGLVSMAYMLHGVLIHRDASLKEGFPVKEITKNALKKGDLIFFYGHVAMYIENGWFIHSSSKRNGVAYNSLDPSSGEYSKELANGILACGSIFTES